MSECKLVRLEEAAEITMGQSPPGNTYNSIGEGMPLLNGPAEFGPHSPIAVQWTTSPTRFARTGDILYCVRGATTGRKNWADRDYVVGRGLAAIRGRAGIADTNYLWFLLDHVSHHLIAGAAGSTFINLPGAKLEAFQVALPPLAEQKRIAAKISAAMAQIERAKAAADEQVALAARLPFRVIDQSLHDETREVRLSDAMEHVTDGVGESWKNFDLLGATRDGVAPAMAAVGKNPGRYKQIDDDTVFYNPMRILIGSIAMLPVGSPSAITSPDYVVVKGRKGILSSRWFFHWLRSPLGQAFILSNAKGAVRERLTWKFLSSQTIRVPTWDAQQRVLPALERHDALVRAIEEQRAEVDSLPSRILAETFDDRS